MKKLAGKLAIIVLLVSALIGTAVSAQALTQAGLQYQETSLGGGLWQYDYTIFNLSEPGYNLYDLYFNVATTVTMDIVQVPNGWDGFGGLGIAEVYSLDPLHDIVAGGSQGGFRFMANAQVGELGYEVLFTAPEVSSVPEPSTLLLLGGGLAGIELIRKRARRKQHLQ